MAEGEQQLSKYRQREITGIMRGIARRGEETCMVTVWSGELARLLHLFGMTPEQASLDFLSTPGSHLLYDPEYFEGGRTELLEKARSMVVSVRAIAEAAMKTQQREVTIECDGSRHPKLGGGMHN